MMQTPGRVRPASLEDVYAESNLTQRQLLMWFGQRVHPSSPGYNVASLFVVDGPIDPPAFSRAAHALVASSDSLRTVLVERDGVPSQYVAPCARLTVEEIDLRNAPDPMARLHELAHEMAQRPFTLDGALFTFAVFHLDRHKGAWFFNMHHIIGDGWSVRLVFERMSELYAQTRRAGGPPAPPALPAFTDWVASQRAYTETADFAADVAWWEQHLAATDPVLLYGRAAPTGSGPARRCRVVLGSERTRRLEALAEATEPPGGRHQALQNLIHTALHAWLHRLGPNEAPTIAVAFHNRRPAFHKTLGLLMQTIPVRMTVTNDETFRSLLEKLVKTSHEALEHRGCVVANSMRRRAWEVVLNHLPSQFGRFADMALLQHEWVHNGHAHQALVVTMNDDERSDDLHLDFDLLLEAFDEAHASALPHHYLALLDAMIDSLDTRIHDVDILTESERSALRRAEGGPAPRIDTTCVGLIERTAVRRATHSAVRTEDDAWTFEEINAEANRLARHLESLGLRRGLVAGIHLRPGPLVPIAVLAVLKAGGAYLPLDASYPTDRLVFMLEDAGVRLVITEERLHRRLALGNRTALVLDADDRDWTHLPSSDLPLRAGLDDIAYVIYTSGSTGRPKGVRIQHRSLVTFLEAIREEWIDETDTVASTTPLSFDLHLGDLLLPLVVGATSVPVSREVATDGSRLNRFLNARGASAIFATPATFRMLIEAGWQGAEGMKVLCAGETMSPELAHDLLLRVATLQNAYGPTETTCYVVRHPVTRVEAPVPIGRPLPGVRLYVLDTYGQPLPDGMPGELVIGGPQVGCDYLGRPDLTRERFAPDPFSDEPGARMYRSGDLGRRRADGLIECLGRIDHQVKIRGYRIELGEIETVLCQHAGVREALVCAREDTPGDKRLVAYIIGGADVADLKMFLRQHLPEYMVPAAFVVLTEFPITPNGKIDRKQLPAPERIRGESADADADAPRDLLQFQITKVFEDVLGVQPIGIHDSFFDLGGNSLLGVRLLLQIERAIDRRIPSLQTLFDAPTPNQLASVLSQDGWQPALGSVIALQPRGDGAPFFCVHAFIGDVCRDLGRHCGPDHPFYGLQPRGLDGREEPLHTIPEMAAFYVQEMRRIQPRGPYHLGGYSFGGLVAVEMATQLREQGEDVAFLAVIDVGPLNLRPTSLGGRLRACVNAPLIALEKLLALVREEPPSRLLSALRHKLRTRMLKRRVTRIHPARASEAGEAVTLVERMYGMSRWPGNYQRIARINLQAMLRHVPRRYDGAITLIRRHKRHHRFAFEKPDWSWSELGARVDVHFIDGDHDEIMVEPGVRKVGRIVEEQLRKAPRHPVEQPQMGRAHATGDDHGRVQPTRQPPGP